MNDINFVEFNPSKENGQPRVLVFLVGSLGDSIVCIPALTAVKRHFADSQIFLLHDYHTAVPVSPLDVVPRHLIDGSLSYKIQEKRWAKIRQYWNLRKAIRRHKFQTVVYLVATERFGEKVKRDKRFFQLCGIKNLYGFYGYQRGEIYHTDAAGKPLPQLSEAVLKLKRLESDGIKIDDLNLTEKFLEFSEAEQNKVSEWLAVRRQKKNARLIAICPGCKLKSNDWGVENYIKLGGRLLSSGDYEIVVLGGAVDQPLAAKMIAAWGEGIDATGAFAPNESGELFRRCDFMIGNDTGSTHLAAAAGIRCFGVFHFRENPGHWFPLGKGHQIIQHDVECAGCHQKVCPKPHRPCMTEIGVEAVWQQLKIFMKEDAKLQDAPIKRILV